MARPAASEEARIVRLRAALERAKSQGLVTASLKFADMVQLVGVNKQTLRDWCAEAEIAESGAFVGHGRGVDYQINPIALLWVLIRFFERKRDQKMRENLRMREAVAGDSLDSAPAEMSLRDAREALSLRLQLIEAEKQAGNLVDRAEAEATYTKLTLGIREAILSAPQKQDPTNEWPPEVREIVDNVLADLMVHLRQAGQEAVSSDGLDTAGAAGTGEGTAEPVRAPRRNGAQRAGTAATA